jgi:L-threonylcarbamoyladenylate synthase
VACLPQSRKGVRRIQGFKKRGGPFLLLVDSITTAASLIRWYPAGLRQLIRSQWPGRTTLIVPGRPGLPGFCYQNGMVAIRVDADAVCRRLARACGGMLLSSSLNRRGGVTRSPCYAVQMRWQQFLSGRAGMGFSEGKASSISRVNHCGMHKIR